jgi:hypothetical protein
MNDHLEQVFNLNAPEYELQVVKHLGLIGRVNNSQFRKSNQQKINAQILHQITGNNLLKIEHTPSGKPYIKNFYPISISHSGNYTALILRKNNHNPIAVDLEPKTRNIIKGVDYFLSDYEIKHIPREENTLLLNCWCIKETAIKYYDIPDIDFKNKIQIKPFIISENGIVEVEIDFPVVNTKQLLHVNYRVTKEFVLSWAL